jgi:starvation-inducible DNA-binding protein
MAHAVLDMNVHIENADVGIDDHRKVAACMANSLADSYLLMVKTQGYHWNVVGPLFYSLHKLTEEHYNNLFAAVDELAERIRALGYPAPASITDMIGRTVITEETGNPTTEQMVKNLIDDHEAVASRFREYVEIAEGVNDVVSAEMLTARLAYHEKSLWMLRAHLTGKSG